MTKAAVDWLIFVAMVLVFVAIVIVDPLEPILGRNGSMVLVTAGLALSGVVLWRLSDASIFAALTWVIPLVGLEVVAMLAPFPAYWVISLFGVGFWAVMIGAIPTRLPSAWYRSVLRRPPPPSW